MDPRLSGLEADLFWLPQVYRRILTALITARPRAFETSRFSLPELQCDKTLLICPDGTQHLLLRRGYRVLQILCLGAPVVAPDCGIGLLASEVPDIEGKVRLMRRFADMMRDQGGHGPGLPWSPHALSLRNALIALDGRLHGATQRQIAEIIFGRDRVARDWESGQGWMRSRVARAARRGMHLAQGGYQTLLG